MCRAKGVNRNLGNLLALGFLALFRAHLDIPINNLSKLRENERGKQSKAHTHTPLERYNGSTQWDFSERDYSTTIIKMSVLRH